MLARQLAARLPWLTPLAEGVQPLWMDEILLVRGVRKSFESEGMPVQALRGLDLELASGEFVAVMGPSGCGKSTLLNLVAGVETPSAGEIVLGGASLSGRDEDDRARLRRVHIGFVFQFFNLLEGMSALENVVLAAAIAGASRRRAEASARVTAQSRDQTVLAVMEADAETGDTVVVFEDTDDAWVDLVPGSPATLDDGRLVVAADRDGRRCLLVDGIVVTPPDIQVRSIAHAGTLPERAATASRSSATRSTTRRSSTCTAGTATPSRRSRPHAGVHTVSAGLPLVVRTSTLLIPGAVTGRTGPGPDRVVRRATAGAAERRPHARHVTEGPSARDGAAPPRRPRRLAAAGAPRPVRRTARAAGRAVAQRAT